MRLRSPRTRCSSRSTRTPISPAAAIARASPIVTAISSSNASPPISVRRRGARSCRRQTVSPRRGSRRRPLRDFLVLRGAPPLGAADLRLPSPLAANLSAAPSQSGAHASAIPKRSFSLVTRPLLGGNLVDVEKNVGRALAAREPVRRLAVAVARRAREHGLETGRGRLFRAGGWGPQPAFRRTRPPRFAGFHSSSSGSLSNATRRVLPRSLAVNSKRCRKSCSVGSRSSVVVEKHDEPRLGRPGAGKDVEPQLGCRARHDEIERVRDRRSLTGQP